MFLASRAAGKTLTYIELMQYQVQHSPNKHEYEEWEKARAMHCSET